MSSDFSPQAARETFASRPKRLLMILNLDRAFLTHRLPIAIAAREEGYEVHLAMAMTDAENELRSYGFIIHPLPIGRGMPGVKREYGTISSLFCLIRRLRPDVLHLVTARPVLYGGLIARLLRIPALAAIPGLGSAFLMGGIKGKLMRQCMKALYRLAIKRKNTRVIVQNSDDERMTREEFGVPQSHVTLVRGSGADLSAYPVMPEPEGPITVTFASRLLYDKGVREFLNAAEILRTECPEVRFFLAGAPDPGNPSSLREEDLENIKQAGHVEVLGHQPEVATLFARSHVVVLPSYREGLPKILIEAAACGRSVVTTDVPGCRDVIEPGTGLLVPVANAKALAEAIKTLVQDAPRRQNMGKAGRDLAERAFDIQRVVKTHLGEYEKLYKDDHTRKHFNIVTTN